MIYKKRMKGITIIITFLVLSIITIIIFAIAAQGSWNLNFVNKDKFKKKAFYAAEAGVNEVLYRYKNEDQPGVPSWKTGIGSIDSPACLSSEPNVQYYVEVTNRLNEGSSAIASDGTTVLPGHAYILGYGFVSNGGPIKEPRNRLAKQSVGVMIEGSFFGRYNYAVTADGDINLKAQSDIYGNIKSNRSVIFNAAIDINQVRGEGNIFAGQNIEVNAKVSMESGQYARARAAFTGKKGASGISGIPESNKIAPDYSVFTESFNVNCESTYYSADGKMNMPYPNISRLLNTSGGVPNYITHSETVINSNFDLGDGIHYFPNGLTLNGDLTGSGTIVVGGGNTLTINTPLGSNNDYFPVNIVVLPSESKTGGDLKFEKPVNIKGLIWAFGAITTKGSFRCKGTVISYKSGVEVGVSSGAQADFQLYPIPVYTPGFEAWLGDPGGYKSRVNVVSWKRN